MKRMYSILLSMLILVSGPALAHPNHGASEFSTSFVLGFLHPIFGLDHLLVFALLGALSYVLSATLRTWSLGLVLAIMSLGFFTGHEGWHALHSDLLENLIVVSMYVSALFVILKIAFMSVFKAGLRTLDIVIATVIPVLIYFHGFAHGHEMSAGTSVFGFYVGFVAAASALVVGGACVSLAFAEAGKNSFARWFVK